MSIFNRVTKVVSLAGSYFIFGHDQLITVVDERKKIVVSYFDNREVAEVAQWKEKHILVNKPQSLVVGIRKWFDGFLVAQKERDDGLLVITDCSIQFFSTENDIWKGIAPEFSLQYVRP